VTIEVPLPARLSPVQRLNREGVEAVRRHQTDKAESLFLKAYLYDPSDPFTLNNLGYLSELHGQLDRAHEFYDLALKQGCNANIALTSVEGLKDKPMTAAIDSLQNLPMRINRMNVDAMRLLLDSRGFDAISLLVQARSLDPGNPFTLNNLGVAQESVGDYQSAIKNYQAASESQSPEKVIVAADKAWKGRPVREMAAANAKRLEKRMLQLNPDYSQAMMFSMRGVAEENRNDWSAAREDFLHAYALDSSSAFSLNNRAYVAEHDGDLETAQFFYQKARKAADSNARVGLATKFSAQGKPLLTVAADSDHNVDGALDAYSQKRREQIGPVELTPRGDTPARHNPAPPDLNSSPDPPSNDLQPRN
jgi:Flp pilus assembly protein TadD